MTENNISDRGGLESRYTADAIDVIIRWHPKLAELYEAEADKKRLLDMFLATFDELGTEVIFYHNMSDGDNIILGTQITVRMGMRSSSSLTYLREGSSLD